MLPTLIPADEFPEKYDAVIKWCMGIWPPEMKQQVGQMVDRLGQSPKDSNLLTNVGNLVISATEQHMSGANVRALDSEQYRENLQVPARSTTTTSSTNCTMSAAKHAP